MMRRTRFSAPSYFPHMLGNVISKQSQPFGHLPLHTMTVTNLRVAPPTLGDLLKQSVGSTPSHIPLKYRFMIKISTQIRHICLNT